MYEVPSGFVLFSQSLPLLTLDNKDALWGSGRRKGETQREATKESIKLNGKFPPTPPRSLGPIIFRALFCKAGNPGLLCFSTCPFAFSGTFPALAQGFRPPCWGSSASAFPLSRVLTCQPPCRLSLNLTHWPVHSPALNRVFLHAPSLGVCLLTLMSL